MLNSDTNDIRRPVGVIFSIFFCIAAIVLFSIVLIATQLSLFPANAMEGYYFQKSGLFVNLLTNAIFACILTGALYRLSVSALYWSFGMFMFDFLSTSYWIFTSNWFGVVGIKGLLGASTFWLGGALIFFYCLKLRRLNILK